MWDMIYRLYNTSSFTLLVIEHTISVLLISQRRDRHMSKRVVQQLPSSRRTSSRHKNKFVLLQANTSSIQIQRPTSNDRSDWEPYWEAVGQLWRYEPEIDKERQDYLALR